jgi:hypothetical protein
MALPKREEQIEAVLKFLDSDWSEGRTLEEIATKIVDSYEAMFSSELKDPPFTPHVGAAFKHPSLSGIWFVGYYDLPARLFWIVSAKAKYGGWIKEHANFWKYCTPSNAKAGAPGNNKKWAVGDLVSQHQRQYWFKVIATGDVCVLLQNRDTGQLVAESNDEMERYYQREADPSMEDVW